VKKLLFVMLLLGSIAGIISSCGPERSFCPNNPPLYNCIPAAGGNTGTGMGGMGQPGNPFCPDGGAQVVTATDCTCSGPGVTTYPCAM
jgi:hypothetical protein